jgi:hypothetical protein
MSLLAQKHGELTSSIETMTNMEKDLGSTIEQVTASIQNETATTDKSDKATTKKSKGLKGLISNLSKTAHEEKKMVKEMTNATKNAQKFGD